MKFKTLLAPLLGWVFLGSANAQFIDLEAGGVKVVFKTIDVVVNGITFPATQASASVMETAADGTITAKLQTQVQVSDGSGGFEQRVTQETTVATLDTVTGTFDVQTTTEVLTTPVDTNGDPLAGATTTTTTEVVNEEDVDENALDLPPTTSFIAVDPVLDIPVLISPE
ncbi:MAG: hypothetical protein OSA93_14965 [Akkermansiaceae bacterium]|nr:hypothetical protein [Akkermansiaceae bacterium]